jgi:hypothetical protein
LTNFLGWKEYMKRHVLMKRFSVIVSLLVLLVEKKCTNGTPVRTYCDSFAQVRSLHRFCLYAFFEYWRSAAWMFVASWLGLSLALATTVLFNLPAIVEPSVGGEQIQRWASEFVACVCVVLPRAFCRGWNRVFSLRLARSIQFKSVVSMYVPLSNVATIKLQHGLQWSNYSMGAACAVPVLASIYTHIDI